MTSDSKHYDLSDEAVKLKELCNMVLHNADAARDKIIDDVTSEITAWTDEQEAALAAECDAISKSADKQAEEITNRQVTIAKNEVRRERIKIQNKYVDEAFVIFQNSLEALRERGDYIEILTGLAFEAILKIPKGQDMLIRLSAVDAGLGEELARIIREAVSVNITFDPVPGGFKGGVMILSADGRWSITLDWHAKTEELKDVITTRILAAL